MVRCFFLIKSFLTSRRLWVVYKYKSSSKCAINSEMCPNFISVHPFFYFHCLPNDVLCKIAIWTDVTALCPSCYEPSGWSQQAFFSHLQVHCFLFNKFFLIYFMNKTRWILSLAVNCFVFNFKSRKSKQT